MKRYSLIEAFHGEPNPAIEILAIQAEGHDAVEFGVKSGKVTVVVPATMSDQDASNLDRLAQAAPWELELELEGGLRLKLWLPEGPTAADVRRQKS